jgi:hypothetical protein
MAPRRVLAAAACAALLALGTAASADQYRAGEYLNLDLSKAVLSPKRLGPPAEFAPVAVEARTDSKPVVADSPKADVPRVVRTTRAAPAQAAKKQPPARSKLARHGNPLEANAMDTRVQKWPCRSGGICNWK